ncbi:hypothetical protein [Halocynthiibacter styelae]|uniref:Uncharacterized protein n=1 Tax=Halocynthiibacter styelae TaxID=2761955 RepID=A0A8J7IZG0_9RHOB|nr:hypothetical protein [Paenihalocynthiibacter styelae]MBI1495220.1 hypothetical protein [Paenihalocynthiibacter styelae]
MSRWLELARNPDINSMEEPSNHPEPSKSPEIQPERGFMMVCGGLMVEEEENNPPADVASPALDLSGLNHREQAICNLVAKGNRARIMGDTVTHALIDRLIERGRIEVGKEGRLKLC